VHVFISYAKKDTRDFATQVYNALNSSRGITAWMDTSLEAAESWALQIQQEIDRCDIVVVLLSPDVNRPVTPQQRRSFVLNEIDYAQSLNRPVIPVMVQPTKVPVQLAGIQYIDACQNPQAGLQRLIRDVTRRAEGREPRPAPPPAAPGYVSRKKAFFRRRIFCCPALVLILCCALSAIWLAALQGPSKNGEFIDVNSTVTALLMPGDQHHWTFNAVNGETGIEPVFHSGDSITVRVKDVLADGALCFRIETQYADGPLTEANCSGSMSFEVNETGLYHVYVQGEDGGVAGIYELTVETRKKPEVVPGPMVVIRNEAAIRADPFPDAPEIGDVHRGDRLPYLETSDNGLYYRVQFGERQGWVPVQNADLEGP